MGRTKSCTDHLGNRFNSVTEMCKYWKIDRGTYQTRIKIGYTLEQALATPSGKLQIVTDHEGNEFASMMELCKYWGVNYDLVKQRLAHGFSMEDALTIPVNQIRKRERIIDAYGNEYTTIDELCKHYNISIYTYYYYKNHGELIDKEASRNREIEITDIYGNRYNTIEDAARDWKIKSATVRYRVKQGWDAELALLDTKGIRVRLLYKGLDGRMRYIVRCNNQPLVAREVVEIIRPDLLKAYDKYNNSNKN